MAWLCVDEDGTEKISQEKLERWQFGKDTHKNVIRFWHGKSNVALPKGSIKRLIGRELTWDDDPVEFVDVVE